jgi:hypothetical protein
MIRSISFSGKAYLSTRLEATAMAEEGNLLHRLSKATAWLHTFQTVTVSIAYYSNPRQ